MSLQLLSVLLLLFVFTIQSEAKYGCPPITVLSRCSTWCKCSSSWNNDLYNYRTVFNCNGYSGTIKELGDFLQNNLDGYEIDDFIFDNYKSDRLPDEAFKGAKVNRIIIRNSAALTNFGYSGSGKTIFDGLGQHLETIVITNTPNIRMEEWKYLADSLSVGSTDPPALKNLIIYRNSATTILLGGLSAIKTLTNLRTIILRSNALVSLEDITRAALDLKPFTKLHLLDLSENRIKEFDADLPNGLTIYLNANRELTKFSQGFFDRANASNIDYVNVKDPNKLDCDCDGAGIRAVVGTELGQRFEGTCNTPSKVRGKRYLTICYDPGYGLVDASNKHLIIQTNEKLS